MLDLQKLKTFQVVAATSNFTRAAAELGYSQSSVTMHIQALERELGAPLFDRAFRHVVLTEAGRRTLDYANRLLALAAEAKAAIHKEGEVNGPLAVSAPAALVAYRLPEVLREFQVLYPQVHLSLSTHPDTQAQVDALLQGDLDMAFVVGNATRSERLTVKPLGVEEILVVASPDYRTVASGEMRLEDLAEEQILLTDRNCPFRQIFERVLTAAHVSLRNILELASMEALKQCALAGMGLAVVPRMAVTMELKHKTLVALPWPGLRFRAHIQMLRHRRRMASPALLAFWGLTENAFREGVVAG